MSRDDDDRWLEPWDDIRPTKGGVRRSPFPPNPSRPPKDIRDELLERMRNRRRKCTACDKLVPISDSKTGSLYRFCPLCGSSFTTRISLEEIKFLLDELNSKLGRYLEDIKRSKTKGNK